MEVITGKPHFARMASTTAKMTSIQKRRPVSGISSDIFYLLSYTTAMKQTITANMATPSMRAAMISMFVLMLPAISG